MKSGAGVVSKRTAAIVLMPRSIALATRCMPSVIRPSAARMIGNDRSAASMSVRCSTMLRTVGRTSPWANQ